MKNEKQKIRVLFVEYGIGFGGSVISLSELINGLKEITSIEPYVLTFQDKTITSSLFSDTKVYNVSKRVNYVTRSRINVFITRHRLLHPFRTSILKFYAIADTISNFLISRKIRKLLREHNIDILHLNNFPEPSGIDAASRSQSRCISHFRGFVSGTSFLHEKKYQQKVIETVDCYIGISTAVTESILSAGIPKEKTRTIPNSLSVAPYRSALSNRDKIRREHKINPGEIVFSVFGRITEWKGQDVFLQAATILLERNPSLSVKFMIVGDTSDDPSMDFSRRIKQLSDNKNLKSNLVYTGYKENAPDYYAASDIVIHCSTEPEPFGRVVIEGMATDNAVIAMDEGGPKDIITHMHDGILCPPRDPFSLARDMELLYHDKTLRKQIAKNAFQTILERHQAARIASRVLDCYKEVLSH